MKEKELRQGCALCDKGIFNAGPFQLIYKVTMEPFMADHDAIARQSGLEQMMGGANPAGAGVALAQALGPNDDMANSWDDKRSVLLCGNCVEEHRIAELYAQAKVGK